MKLKKIVGLLLALSLILFFLLSLVFFKSNFKLDEKKLSNKKCGDGFCDAIEKQNINFCPEDCLKKIEPTILNNSAQNNSPFGFHPGNANNYSFIQDLGASWSREGYYLIWNWIDPKNNRKYNFKNTLPPSPPSIDKNFNSTNISPINYDEQWQKAPEKINIVSNICPFFSKKNENSLNEKDLLSYQYFVQKTVERYDGDDDFGCVLKYPDCYYLNDNQYPSEKTIAYFKNHPIKYWQVCNHFADVCDQGETQEKCASSFAEVQKNTYLGIKSADKSASVLIAGDSPIEEYPAVLKILNGNYIDIIDYHRFGNADQYNPKTDFDFLKKALVSSNFTLNKIHFWITETGTYSGQLQQINSFQNEKKQAIGLFKNYISSLANGIEKIFWAWNIKEGFYRDCSFWDYTGLVYDGCDCIDKKYTCGNNVGYDQGDNVKKLAYYTYKKMVEELADSDWKNIKIIQEDNGVFVFKFIKNNHSIWIAWNENSTNKNLTLSDIETDQVTVIEAVPSFQSGKEIVDYQQAFKEKKVLIKEKTFIQNLTNVPIIIKEN